MLLARTSQGTDRGCDEVETYLLGGDNMAVDLHYNEIARAVRRSVQDGRLLTADSDGTDVVHAASDGLQTGDVVEVGDDAGGSKRGTVSSVPDAGTICLVAPLSGTYSVSRNAMLRPVRAGEPDLKWIGQGPVELMPEPRLANLPCVVVCGGGIEQPLTGGTNRSYTQEYHYRVYYVQRLDADETGDASVMDEAGVIFRRLMADTYLGGTCWYSQVVRVDPQPRAGEVLRGRGMPVRVVEMELVARRAEVT
jgi:hypothetical protein